MAKDGHLDSVVVFIVFGTTNTMDFRSNPVRVLAACHLRLVIITVSTVQQVKH